MKRKIISCVLVASLSFSIGCYSNGKVTTAEFKSQPNQVDITLFTKDSLQYRFLKENYRVHGDTVTGVGVRRGNLTSEIVLDAAVSFADVDSIETKKFDATNTILLCGGVGLGVALIIVILSRHNQEVMVSPIYISGASGQNGN